MHARSRRRPSGVLRSLPPPAPQKTAALGAQLQGIQSMLTELGELDAAA